MLGEGVVLFLAQMEQQPSKRSYSSRESTDRGIHTHNRVHRRVITRDIGKNIEKASSLVAVISRMIGVINGAFLLDFH